MQSVFFFFLMERLTDSTIWTTGSETDKDSHDKEKENALHQIKALTNQNIRLDVIIYLTKKKARMQKQWLKNLENHQL